MAKSGKSKQPTGPAAPRKPDEVDVDVDVAEEVTIDDKTLQQLQRMLATDLDLDLVERCCGIDKF